MSSTKVAVVSLRQTAQEHNDTSRWAQQYAFIVGEPASVSSFIRDSIVAFGRHIEQVYQQQVNQEKDHQK